MQYQNRHGQHSGIIKWMNSIGLDDKKNQNIIIDRFLKHTKFDSKTVDLRRTTMVKAQAAWISQRFSSFKQFVFDNTEEVDA